MTTAEAIAQELHDAQEQERSEFPIRWDQVPPQTQEQMVDAVESLLEREVISPGFTIAGAGWLQEDLYPERIRSW